MTPAPGQGLAASRPSGPPTGHDFGRIAVHRPPAGVGTATGKAGGALADDETWGMPITGNGGSGAAPDAGVAAAAGPAAATPPKLKKSTVRGPTAYDCGAFEWVVQWELDRKTTKGGWVVQKVELSRDVKDCAGKALSPGKTPNMLSPSWYPLWEAWEIHKNQSVTTYAEGGDLEDDGFGSRATPNTKATLGVRGTAEFHEGVALPASFKVTNKAPTWILPATRSDPKLAGGTGAISHHLTATWDCCGADKTTKLNTV